MNQMQQMLMQAQKMQRDMRKAHEELNAKEFKVSKGGLVEIVVMGDKSIKEVNIEKDALGPENGEMIEEALKMAFQEVFATIDAANEQIEEKITGQKGGLGF
jgi:nucleoid-associated protein EbfC